MIRVESLGTGAGSFALRDISFEVKRGEWCAVVGATGSGKTTLVECLAGLAPAHTGRVTLADREVTRLPPEDRHVGLVYQQAFLFPHLSVGDNVAYGATDAAAARALAGRLGVESLWFRDVRQLSGGERQLVALARALARRAPVLLLDEPFASLDFTRRAHVRAEVRAIAAEWDATALMVTHDLGEAAAVTEHTLHLAEGRVANSGPSEELIAHLLNPQP